MPPGYTYVGWGEALGEDQGGRVSLAAPMWVGEGIWGRRSRRRRFWRRKKRRKRKTEVEEGEK